MLDSDGMTSPGCFFIPVVLIQLIGTTSGTLPSNILLRKLSSDPYSDLVSYLSTSDHFWSLVEPETNLGRNVHIHCEGAVLLQSELTALPVVTEKPL